MVQCQENKDGGKHDLKGENKFLSLQLTPDTSVSFQKAYIYIYIYTQNFKMLGKNKFKNDPLSHISIRNANNECKIWKIVSHTEQVLKSSKI